MVSHNNNQEEIISVIATDGSVVEFINEAIGFGNNGKCYFSSDRNHSIFIYDSITDEQIKCIILNFLLRKTSHATLCGN